MRWIVAFVLLMAAPALAQQQPDSAFLQRAITVLQQQRNAALDSLAQIQTQASIQAEEVAKLKARITELEEEKKK